MALLSAPDANRLWHDAGEIGIHDASVQSSGRAPGHDVYDPDAQFSHSRLRAPSVAWADSPLGIPVYTRPTWTHCQYLDLRPLLTFQFPGKAPWTLPFPAIEPAPAAGADRHVFRFNEAALPFTNPAPPPQKHPKSTPPNTPFTNFRAKFSVSFNH